MITLLEHRASLTTTEEQASKGWSRQALAPRIMRGELDKLPTFPTDLTRDLW